MRRPDDWDKLQMFLPRLFCFHKPSININAEAGGSDRQDRKCCWFMDVKTAKNILENETHDVNTNVHEPLNNKWATWKIIDYLWNCHLENVNCSEQKEWLINLYKEAGMTETELNIFMYEIDLLMETIRRNPLNR